MSYILEALKKSQQERELGHVPRLQTVAFDDQPADVGPQRWVYAALTLAFVAVGIAMYALFRPGVTSEPAASLVERADTGSSSSSAPAIADASTALNVADRSVSATDTAAERVSGPDEFEPPPRPERDDSPRVTTAGAAPARPTGARPARSSVAAPAP
ncbi:MAG: hypothetical protein WBG92_21805, partial [Thiohalocapsa sp.]